MMQLVTYLKTTFQLHVSWHLCFLHLQRHPYPLCLTVNFVKQKTYWQAAQGRCSWHWHTASVCIPTTQAASVSRSRTCGVFGFITVTLNTVRYKPWGRIEVIRHNSTLSQPHQYVKECDTYRSHGEESDVTSWPASQLALSVTNTRPWNVCRASSNERYISDRCAVKAERDSQCSTGDGLHVAKNTGSPDGQHELADVSNTITNSTDHWPVVW
jgi:hypothetical protein